MTVKSFNIKRFKNIGILTVAIVYFLILVGGIVRSTGSGMGCPDWPKCFGSWVPPTTVNQLPDDYLEVYKEKRIAKNQRVAGTLEKLGFHKAAKEIFDHPATYIETEFNVTKTWIEYINRLVGVVTGILIFLTLLYSVPFLKFNKAVSFYSLIAFLLVGFQGWLGSLVVSTNLVPEMITLHMALALVLVAVLIYAIALAEKDILKINAVSKVSGFYLVLVSCLAFTFFQTILGTQVREDIDRIAFELGGMNRELWIDKLGTSFFVHRSFSILMVFVNLYLFYLVRKVKHKGLVKLSVGMMVLLFLEIIFGVVMAYFAIPASMQPLHLLFASLLFGVQFYMLIVYRFAHTQIPGKVIAA